MFYNLGTRTGKFMYAFTIHVIMVIYFSNLASDCDEVFFAHKTEPFTKMIVTRCLC